MICVYHIEQSFFFVYHKEMVALFLCALCVHGTFSTFVRWLVATLQTTGIENFQFSLIRSAKIKWWISRFISTQLQVRMSRLLCVLYFFFIIKSTFCNALVGVAFIPLLQISLWIIFVSFDYYFIFRQQTQMAALRRTKWFLNKLH